MGHMITTAIAAEIQIAIRLKSPIENARALGLFSSLMAIILICIGTYRNP